MAKITRAITEIETLIIHCSASPNGRPVSVEEIDGWHQARSFLRGAEIAKTFNPTLLAIGYHFVIDVTGLIHTGRHPTERGAHAINNNARSLGICVIGMDKFTETQWHSLAKLVTELKSQYTIKKIIGHREVEPHKTCPNFDVQAWLADSMRAPQENIFIPHSQGENHEQDHH